MAPVKSYVGYSILVVSIVVVSAGLSMLLASSLYSSIVVDVKGFSKRGFSSVELDSTLLCSYDKIEVECGKPPIVMLSSISREYNQSRVVVAIKPICIEALKQEEEYLKQRRSKEPIILSNTQILCGTNAMPKRVVLVKDSSPEGRLGLALVIGGLAGVLGAWLALKPARTTRE